MRILSFKPGHDGTVAYLEDGRLVFSLEAEKDSNARLSSLHPATLMSALSALPDLPDVLASGGWYSRAEAANSSYLTGYYGWEDDNYVVQQQVNGSRNSIFFSSTHERSHLLCAYGLSPFEQGEFCYALIWEGHIAALYEIDEQVRVKKIGDVLPGIGAKYLLLYNIANESDHYDYNAAGKLMALAAYSKREKLSDTEQQLLDQIIGVETHDDTDLSAFRWSEHYGAGVETDRFKNMAGVFTDLLFDRFLKFAQTRVRRRAPLLIAGGCGLNCDWSTRWLQSGLFTDVFVPPCANDSGSAIGTAIDAQLQLTGNAKVDWTVYSGSDFDVDQTGLERDYDISEFDPSRVAKLVVEGNVLGWVQGKYEIGPRALGHRSILAEPLSTATRDRINRIKQREAYRPVAPVCLESSVNEDFDWAGPSPYMLYFQKVKNDRLKAVTHVDGTARIQTATRHDNERLCDVLEAYRRLSGVAVMCNTSLNYLRNGFINRMSDLTRFVSERELDGFAVDDKLFMPRGVSHNS